MVLGIVVVTLLCFKWLKGNILHILQSVIRHYCLYLKDMALKHKGYLINNFDPAQTYLKQQLEKNFKITFASSFKKGGKKKKERKK